MPMLSRYAREYLDEDSVIDMVEAIVDTVEPNGPFLVPQFIDETSLWH